MHHEHSIVINKLEQFNLCMCFANMCIYVCMQIEYKHVYRILLLLNKMVNFHAQLVMTNVAQKCLFYFWYHTSLVLKKLFANSKFNKLSN